MPKNDLYYNCGEFRPGKRPVADIPSKGPPKGSNHIPIDGRNQKSGGGAIPVPPEELFKCDAPSPGQQPIGGRIVCGPCIRCTPDDIAKDATSPPDKQRCKYKARAECEQKKINDPYCCREVAPRDELDPPSGGGKGKGKDSPEPPSSGGGKGKDGVEPPTTGGGKPTKFKCVGYKGKMDCSPCAPNETTYIHPKTGKSALCADLATCLLGCIKEIDDSIGGVSRGFDPPITGGRGREVEPPTGGIPKDGLGNPIPTYKCIEYKGRFGCVQCGPNETFYKDPISGGTVPCFKTLDACQSVCRDRVGTESNIELGVKNFIGDLSDIIVVTSPKGTLSEEYQELGFKPPIQENIQKVINTNRITFTEGESVKQSSEVFVDGDSIAKDLSLNPTVLPGSLVIDLNEPERSASVRKDNTLDIYSPKSIIETNFSYGIIYSEANIRSFVEEPEFGGVPNNKWLSIFATTVDWRIDRLLTVLGTSAAWEAEYFNISLDNLDLSLTPQLRSAIDKIQQVDGTLLTKNKVLESIRDLLLHNNLHQLDVDYLITLSSRTQNPKFITPAKQVSSKEKNVLSYALTNAQLIDASAIPNRPGEEIRISQPFFTDVKTHTFIELSGVTYKIYLDDAGLNLRFSGTGEYLDPTLYDDISLTFGEEITTLDLEDSRNRSFSLVNEDKYLIGKLIETEMGDRLVASSTVSASEFGAYYDLNSNLSSMLFEIDRTTLETLTRENNVVGRTRAIYTKIDSSAVSSTFEDLKFKWGNTYFINPQDPFAVYLLPASSTIQATFKDFNIHSMVDIIDEEDNLPIFVRKIPWYLIVIPATGRYSPLNISSKLETYSDDGITRSIVTNPHFDPLLGKDVLFNKPVGIDYVHIFPERDADNQINAQALAHSLTLSALELPYFQTSSYFATEIPRKRPPLGNVIRMIININNNYYLNKGLNWYDIVKRLTAEEVGAFIAGIDVTKELVETIMRGEFPGAPVRVFHSLETPDDRYLTRVLGPKSNTITIEDEIDVGGPVLGDPGGGSGPLSGDL